jgi:monovalent cation:H+ antiporter-2, CPA2 family
LLQDINWLDDVLVFLAAAGIIVPLLHRARLGSILGFIIVGVIIGPHGLGRLQETQPWIVWITIEHTEQVSKFADWGVVFLLFLIGLEVSIGRLWELRRYVFGVGALQMALSTVAITIILHFAGLRTAAAIVLGLGLAQSSTAIVMQMLVEQGRAGTPLGQVALAILLFQDLMVIPTLFVAGMDHSAAFNWTALGLTLAQGVGAIVGILLVGRFILRPLLHVAVKTGSRELIMAITLLLVVGAAGATEIAGLSSAFGAFLAGLLLSESEYRHQIEIDLEPFKGLLLGLFFTTVGMMLDPVGLIEHAPVILAGLVVLIVVKVAELYLAARLFRVSEAVSAELALLLAQAGEFALVTIGLASMVGLLSESTTHVALGVAVLSMMLTPLMGMLGRRLGDELARKGERGEDPASLLSDHVIISGYGRVAQVIARMLESEHVPYIALELNSDVVREHHKTHGHVFFGDAGRPEMLERAGAQHARAFLITNTAYGDAERIARAVLRLRPNAVVLARARDAEHAKRLAGLGVSAAVPETIEASLTLGGRVLSTFGLSEDVIARRLALTREAELAKLNEEKSAKVRADVRPATS